MVLLESEQYSIHDTSASIKKLALVASIAAAIQYGWALQLSLLTPYIQLLGVSHTWAAFVWLCGPVSGLFIQPTIGHYSDICTLRYGRRRPFLVAGSILLCLGVLLIGYAADIGQILGDDILARTKPRAVAVFVVGFWILDISNNIVQGPCRALLADLSGDNEAKLMISNALFAFYMAVGNIIGYAAGSHSGISNMLPFTKTLACDHYCANLKTCFLFSILFVTVIITLVASVVEEQVLDPFTVEDGEESLSFFCQLAIAVGSLPRPMWNLLLVTALNWVGWFPFTMFSTDWMGKEIYGGQAEGNDTEVQLYQIGVWAGTQGLMLYIITLAVVSLFMEMLVSFVGSIKRVWAISNFILAICMAMTIVITQMADNARSSGANMTSGAIPLPPEEVILSFLTLFAVLGIPQAVTYSIPFAMASMSTNNTDTLGQGLALGVVNLAIVIPQMFVALVSGPLDAQFGGGNLPAFIMGAIAAALSGIFAFRMLEV